MKKITVALVFVLAVVILLLIIFWPRQTQAPVLASPTPTSTPTLLPTAKVSPQALPQAEENPQLVVPVAEFFERITKKPFGIFITPQNSPVSPEKFTGYHTGVDVEYEDVAGDVVVRSVTAGQIVLARTASGYGGVVAVQHEIDGQDYLGVYGHLDPSRLPQVGQEVELGQQLGFLGAGYSSQTDGERKHLHFALVRGTDVDLRGYVQNEAELQQWQDPAEPYGF